MKLKQLLDKRTIDMLLKNKEGQSIIFDKDFEKITIKNLIEDHPTLTEKTANQYDFSSKDIQPYLRLIVAEETLDYLRKHDRAFYLDLYSKIEKDKEKAEINIANLMRKVPGLRMLNKVVKFYP
jgi:hypothetical protein